jgi:hypothetical protein
MLLLWPIVLDALHAQASAQVSQACPAMQISIVAASAASSSRHVAGPAAHAAHAGDSIDKSAQ